jgi:hypothetical protein
LVSLALWLTGWCEKSPARQASSTERNVAELGGEVLTGFGNSVAWTVGGIFIFCGAVLAGSAILKFRAIGVPAAL